MRYYWQKLLYFLKIKKRTAKYPNLAELIASGNVSKGDFIVVNQQGECRGYKNYEF